MHRVHLVPLAAAGALLLAACSADDTSSNDATRTIEIDMVDIAFEPDTIEVAAGETVRFVFTNNGEVVHDAYIGDEAAQADHEADMGDSEDDEHGGGHGSDDPDAVTVEPDETGELTHTFDEPATLEIGCHQPGHYEAGMKIDIEVAR